MTFFNVNKVSQTFYDFLTLILTADFRPILELQSFLKYYFGYSNQFWAQWWIEFLTRYVIFVFMLQKFTCFTILVIFTWFLTKRNLVTDVLLFLLLLIRSWWAAQNFAVTAFCRARARAWPASYAPVVPVSTVVMLERWWWLLRLRLRR